MAGKKNFTQGTETFINPTMQFISKETVEAVEGKTEEPVVATSSLKGNKPPVGYKNNPEYIETKSKRVQLLVQPSVYEAVKQKASSIGISTNEAINEALRQYVEM